MNDTSDEDLARLQQACESLGEHFDSIQIFATRHDPDRGNGGTTNASWGSGNWFARKGQIEEWLLKQDERSRIEVRQSEKED